MKISKEFLRNIFHGEASCHVQHGGFAGLFLIITLIGSLLGFIGISTFIAILDYIKSLIQ